MSRAILILSLGLVVTGLMVACTPTEEPGGVIGYKPGMARVNRIAPEIAFLDANGRATTLSRVRQEIGVLVFTSCPPDKPCHWINPKLIDAAKRFESVDITIVQVTTPTDKCKHGPGCTERGGTGVRGLIGLCDENRESWNAYGQPADDTVFLLDENNKIVMMSTVAEMDGLLAKAEELARDVARRHEGEHSGAKYIGVGP